MMPSRLYAIQLQEEHSWLACTYVQIKSKIIIIINYNSKQFFQVQERDKRFKCLQTHRHKKQTYGYQKGKVGRG